MGGDTGPEVVIPGAALSAERHPEVRFLLVGDRSRVAPLVERYPKLKQRAEILHTEVFVTMDAKPSQALRKGRRTSSMWMAIEAVKRGEADAAVSAGNTGALMAMAKIDLRTMAGIEPPGPPCTRVSGSLPSHLRTASSTRISLVSERARALLASSCARALVSRVSA